MGGRMIMPMDEASIIADRPATGPRGRKARVAAYRAERASEAAQKAAERPFKLPPPSEHVSPLPPPEEYWPEWDWSLKPWGPPLDDPEVAAYCEIQWSSYRRWAERNKSGQ